MTPAEQNRERLELMNDIFHFVERADVSGKQQRARNRYLALLNLRELQAWFDADDVDWEHLLIHSLVGYVEAWDRQ